MAVMEQPPKWVEQYIGIPYKSLGRNKKGCDCWGIVRLVLSEKAHVYMPSYDEDYVSEKDIQSITSITATQKLQWKRTDYPTTFDVAEMAIPVELEGKYILAPVHVGILVNNNYLLHTNRKAGSHLTSIYSKDINIKGFWRYSC